MSALSHARPMALHRLSRTRPSMGDEQVLGLRAGEWLQVRSREEILDANGRLDETPFMPEMLKFCGARMMSKSARTRPAIQRLASVVARWPTQCICRTSAATARRMMAARPGA